MIKLEGWPFGVGIPGANLEENTSKLIDLYHNDKEKWENYKRNINITTNKEIKKLVSEYSRGKCMFCETVGDHEVHNFRPSTLTKFQKNEDLHEGYWWLMSDFRNMVYICKQCNVSQKNYFPVNGKRAPFPTSSKEIDKAEKRLILDPRLDSPEKHIRFEKDGAVIPISKIGQVTIDVFNLNRGSLVERRKKLIDKIFDDFLGRGIDLFDDTTYPYPVRYDDHRDTIKFLQEYYLATEGKTEFTGVVRTLLAPIMKASKAFGASVFNFKIKSYCKKGKRTFRKIDLAERISSIKIDNFIGIRSLDLAIDTHDPSLILIGENGAGKSSFLKAISFLVMTKRQREKFLIENKNIVYRHGNAQIARISIEFDEGKSRYSLEIDGRTNKIKENGNQPRLRILGFGPNRVLQRNLKYRQPNSKNINALISSYYFLSNSHVWIADEAEVEDEIFVNAAVSIAELFDLGKGGVRRNYGELEFKINGRYERFQDLSEGYKSITSIILDIIMNFSIETSDFKSFSGIVLIDEIENHLHPSWKRFVTGYLNTMFPNIQFIISSHDPLTLHSMKGCKIVKFSKHYRDGEVVLLPRPLGKNAEQLLTGEFFDLESTFDIETSFKYKSYLNQLQRKGQNLNVEEEDLRSRLGGFAETSLERLAHALIAENVRDQVTNLTYSQRKRLMDNVRIKLLNRKK